MGRGRERAGGRRSRRRTQPFQIMLGASQRRWLKTMVSKPTAQQRQVTRARIVLLAAAGWTNAGIARKLEIAPNTAAKWRKRYVQQGVEALADRKRAGRPRGFTAPVVEEVKAIACEVPATRGVPLGRWSLRELRQEIIASELVEDVSTTRLGRWLAEDASRPWRHHAWIFPRDSAFRTKAPECWTCTRASSTAGPRARRVRHQHRCEDQHPGALPRHPAAGLGAQHARRARV
jgi:transposase